MPYTRKGNCVYKETGKKMGCSKDAKTAEKYMSALYAAESGNLKEGFEPETIDPNQPEIAVTVELPNPTQLMANFISTLFSSRTQAHIFHLQVKGPGAFAAHKALNEYYDDIIDLIDSYAEMAQGRYGIIKGYTTSSQIFEDDSVVKYFMGLQKFVDMIRQTLPQDGELNNTVDEISGLVSATIYKLRFLK
jgi:DNA-binding ferritin-like protein